MLQCPNVYPPDQLDASCANLLHHNVLEVVVGAPYAGVVVPSAVRPSPAAGGVACATPGTVTFLLETVLALRSAGPVPIHSANVAARLTVC